MNFLSLQIVTNGEKFRIQGNIRLANDLIRRAQQWLFLGEDYFGSESHGYRTSNIYEFDTKDKALSFIKDQYGREGLSKIHENWIPC